MFRKKLLPFPVPWHAKLLIGFLCVDAFITLTHIFYSTKLGFFNLDKEGNLESVVSGMYLLMIAFTATVYTYILSHRGASRLVFTSWGFFSLGFFYIAIDEMMMIHERTGFVLNHLTGMTGYWGESFNWLIYFSPFIALGLLMMVITIRSIWISNPLQARILLAAGLGLSFSVGMEVIGSLMLKTSLYQSLIVMEESSQLIGESLFAVGLLSLANSTFHKTFVKKERT